jgi:hypothetical protein
MLVKTNDRGKYCNQKAGKEKELNPHGHICVMPLAPGKDVTLLVNYHESAQKIISERRVNLLIIS